jgi:endonuclease-3
MKKQDQANNVYDKLLEKWPDAHCELEHKNAYELLIATILSAQSTDKKVNEVTDVLFKRYKGPHELGQADIGEVEDIIRATGFYKNKAKNIVKCSQELVEKHNGAVPKSIEELVVLPGVGKKTANVVLANAFNINLGIAVDTHVKRIAKLLGLTDNTDPLKVEEDLKKLYPQENWNMVTHLMIFLGRRICTAKKQYCDICPVSDICPKLKS